MRGFGMLDAIGGVLAAVLSLGTAGEARAADVLVEAESFSDPGGWVVDQQFMDVMGSPYLLAHGLGKPVAAARKEVEFPAPGKYHLWVRTKDWVPSHHPGTFKVVVDGVPAPAVFGNRGEGRWLWQDGGEVEIRGRKAWVELADLTGFDGRCDALLFTTDARFAPPREPDAAMAAWRKKLLGLPETPPSAGSFDVVVVGGGIAGTAAAVSAARLGCTVALIHDRPVLGGNNSPEIRVHSGGDPGPLIVREIAGPYGHNAKDADWFKEPSGATEAADRRQNVVEAEKNLREFLGWHAFAVAMQGSRIESVDARNITTQQELRFSAPVFIDCTGDGWIGFWAGAEWRMGREARSECNESIAPEKADAMVLGTSLLWGSRNTGRPVLFPEVPWATMVSSDLAATYGDWTWEYGHHLDTIKDAEEIRDHLLRAIYGSFATARKKDPQKYGGQELAWVGYVGGKRESRRLIGDYLLTENDVRATRQFPDGVAMGSWSIDLHYPKGYEFRTYASHVKVKPYPIPFRCLYSKNIENLMMAGRNISETHVALGTTRVMNTGGQMGVATGAAALLCKKYGATPRGVYEKHLKELLDILKGEGEYKGILKGKNAPAEDSGTPKSPAALGLTVRTLDRSGTRCTDGNPLASVPEAYLGLPCVTISRGSYTAPAPGFSFTVDKAVTVYIAVHNRGTPSLPDGWEKAHEQVRWKAGAKEMTDTVYKKVFPAGKVDIPGHNGKDGSNYGLPHMAIIAAEKGEKVNVTTP